MVATQRSATPLVPAHPALHGPIDEKLGHYRRFTRKTLRVPDSGLDPSSG